MIKIFVFSPPASKFKDFNIVLTNLNQRQRLRLHIKPVRIQVENVNTDVDTAQSDEQQNL